MSYASVIHLSDIHIRSNDDSGKSRYSEYMAVFQNLYDALKGIEEVKNNQAIIIITGDIFHSKGKIFPNSLNLAINLFVSLSKLAPLYVICGNHDFRQDLPAEPDMISSLMTYQIPNVFYLDKTGQYTIGNIGIGLTIVQETLLQGATSGVEQELPPFPDPAKLQTEHKIALFHGSITHAHLQNGRTFSEDMHGYPIDWFNGYDYILLGDIHLQQIHRGTSIKENHPLHNTIQTGVYIPDTSGKAIWAYPGSLIQQDFGETLLGHGFIHWDLKNKKIIPYHVYNPYGYVTACYTNSEINILHRITGKSTWVRLGAIIDKEWFPQKIRLRFTGNNLTTEQKSEIEEKFREGGKEIISSSEIAPSQISNSYDENPDNNSVDTFDIRTITSADMWIQYIINNNDTDIIKNNTLWHQWFKNPEALVIPSKGIEGNILKKIQERNAKIISIVETLQNKIDKSHNKASVSGKITLRELNWSWLLNYGKDNHFDFTKNQGKIYVLNGKNGNGKSNFMETICVALFGEGFPSRYNKAYGAELICNKKPDGEITSTELIFGLDNDMYYLLRTMYVNSTNNTMNIKAVKLSKLNKDIGEYELIHQGASAVNAWVLDNVGSLDMFLMTCMFSQNADGDFFSLPKKEQKELLDRVLSLEAIECFKGLFKEAKNAYSLVMENIQSYVDGLTTLSVNLSAPQKLQDMKKELDSYARISEELYHKWNHVSEKELNSIKSLDDLQDEISEITLQLLHIVPVDVENIQERRIELKSKYTELGIRLSEILKILGTNAHSEEKTESVEGTENQLWDKFQVNIQELQNHALYSKEREKELQTFLIEEENNGGSELLTDKSDKELLDMINQFSSWKKEQVILFRKKETLLQNPSQSLSEMKAICESKNSRLQECLSQHLVFSRKLDDTKKALIEEIKISKKLSERRPNRSSKTLEWIKSIEKHCIGKNLSDIEQEHICISENIIKLPIIQERIMHLEQEIGHYEELIEQHKNTPFNPKCSACQQQPWKILINDIITNKLPESNRLIEAENDKLLRISIGEPENFEELRRLLVSKQQQLHNTIDLIKEYENERELYNTWVSWETKHIENKHTIEKLQQEEQTCQKDIMKTEKELDNINGTLEDMNIIISDLEEYIAGSEIEKDVILAEQVLHRKWKLLLSKVYTSGRLYFDRITKERETISGEINHIEQYIEQQKIHDKLMSRYQRCTTLVSAFPCWKQYKETRTKEDLLSRKYSELESAYARYSPDFQTTIEEIRNKHKYITILGDAFDGFREWLYKEKLSKMIQQNCNSVLKLICGNELILETEWLKTIDTLSWFVRNGDKRCILEKASGFQRFILGIAMRVAISRIGVCKTVFTQMFIDEGFTACDSDNIEKIGGFLRGIMPLGGMYLTTHLEVIKGCADFTIGIVAKHGIAELNFGERSLCKTENKKKGRPKKQSKYNL